MSAAHQRLASVAAHLGGAQVRSHAAAAGPALAPTIKALVFDVFGTVVDWRGSVAREIAAVAARHGRGGTDANAFAMRWRALDTGRRCRRTASRATSSSSTGCTA
jgi:hypothetical protein